MQEFMKEKSFENCRLDVLWLTNMVDTKMKMKGKYEKQYTCPHCIDGLQAGLHLKSCKAYEELRQGIDSELDQKKPGYLRKVITRREKLESKLGRRN